MAENKTFTQEEVSEIVRDRLRRVQDEFKAGGIPEELVSLVPLGDDESCNNALALLKKNYVSVHSPVSGVSPENRGRTTPQKTGNTANQIREAMGLKKGV